MGGQHHVSISGPHTFAIEQICNNIESIDSTNTSNHFHFHFHFHFHCSLRSRSLHRFFPVAAQHMSLSFPLPLCSYTRTLSYIRIASTSIICMLVSVLFIFGLHAHPLGIIHPWTIGFPDKNTKNTENIYIKPLHRKNGFAVNRGSGN